MIKYKEIHQSKKPPRVRMRVVYCSPNIHYVPKWKRDLQNILNQMKKEGRYEQPKYI